MDMIGSGHVHYPFRMKKSDLTVGEEYALGLPSRYDRFRSAHVRVVDLDGEATNRFGRQQRGIIVELVQDSTTYRYRGSAGDRLVLKSARDIQQPWTEYVEARREHERREAEKQREQQRRDKAAEDALARLRGIGFEFTPAEIRWNGDRFSVEAHTMKRLADRVS